MAKHFHMLAQGRQKKKNTKEKNPPYRYLVHFELHCFFSRKEKYEFFITPYKVKLSLLITLISHSLLMLTNSWVAQKSHKQYSVYSGSCSSLHLVSVSPRNCLTGSSSLTRLPFMVARFLHSQNKPHIKL